MKVVLHVENQSLKIEVYGIPETVSRCPGCIHVRKILEGLGLPFSFYDVLSPSQDGVGFTYDRPLIVSLAERAGFPTLNIRYPVIFVDDKLVHNIRFFKQLLLEKGFDPDIIED